MTQQAPRFCPNCGSPLEPGHRFCAECGAVIQGGVDRPTELAQENRQTQPGMGGTNRTGTNSSTIGPNTTSGAQFYNQTTEEQVIPPPPPITSYDVTPAPSSMANYASSPGTFVTVPDYAKAPRRSHGCAIASVVLLLVLVLSGLGIYFAFFQHTGNTPRNTTGNQNTPGGNTPASGDTTPTAGGNTTTPGASGSSIEQLNLKFTYASIQYTITSVQYATSFSDDSSVTSGVRVNFKEYNTASNSSPFLYSDVSRLILADGTIVAPGNAQNSISPNPQTSRTNWLDFAVSSAPANLSQLVLQMGSADQNQMHIPLNPTANLSKYQDKTVNPNMSIQYRGLNWTITQATQTLSLNGKQATAGNVYVIVTLRANNTSSNTLAIYYGDFARLKVGDTTSSPTTDSTFPTDVASQTQGTGTVVFLVPQGNTNYTLILLGDSTASPPVSQATANFTIQ